jgi:hypothetical protein
MTINELGGLRARLNNHHQYRALRKDLDSVGIRNCSWTVSNCFPQYARAFCRHSIGYFISDSDASRETVDVGQLISIALQYNNANAQP